MRLRIQEKVLLGFMTLIAIAAVIAFGEYWSLGRVKSEIQLIDQTRAQQGYLFEIQRYSQALDRDIDRYMSVPGDDYREVILADIQGMSNVLVLLEVSIPEGEYKAVVTSLADNVDRLQEKVNALLSFEVSVQSAGAINAQVVEVYRQLEAVDVGVAQLSERSDSVFKTQVQEVSSRINSVISQLILFVLIAFVLALVVSLTLSRTLTRSVSILMRAAMALTGGDYSARAKVQANDEMGQLAKAFNIMAARLQEYTTQLEAQVAERTKQLDEKVAQLDQGGKLLIRRDLALSRANEELRSLDKMKTEFVSVVTHQLRTPLSAVKWVLSILLQGEFGTLTNDQRAFLAKAQESNQRMINLVNDLASADHIDSGRFKPVFIPTAVYDLVQNLLIEMQPLIVERKIRMLVENNLPTAARVVISPENLRAVIQNLIENSLKYTKPGGEVKVLLREDGDMVAICVSDTGIGIPAADHPRIFSRFYRAPNALKMETDGSGLGLYIVRNIVESYAGMISFTSKEGVGTTVVVKLPRATKEYGG